MPIFNSVYKSFYEWKPGANTIAYYKFDGNLNDSSGNSRDLSMYTGSFSYETLSSGKKICRFNTSAQTTNLTIPFNRTAYTVSCYASWKAISTTYHYISLDLSSGSNYFPRIYNYGRNNRQIVSGIASFDDCGASYVQDKWYYIVSVYENNVASLYINGQFIHSETYSDSSTSGVLSINGISTYNTNYRSTGGLSELIFEDKIWTADQILDYYNQTKGDYGIS